MTLIGVVTVALLEWLLKSKMLLKQVELGSFDAILLVVVGVEVGVIAGVEGWFEFGFGLEE